MNEVIRSRSLMGYRELVRQLGGNPERLIKQHGLDAAQFDSDVLIPYVNRVRLLEGTAAALDCPDFGLRLAASQNVNTMGPLALLAQHSKTVGEAYSAIRRYLPYHSTALHTALDAHTRPHLRRMTYAAVVSGCPQRRQSMELALCHMQSTLRLFLGKSFNPDHVLFRHEAGMPLRLYSNYFSCPVRFGQDVNALVIPASVFDRVIDQASPDLLRVVESFVADIVEQQPTNIAGQVKALVNDLLQTSQCTVEYVAQRLCMHKRTLQRRLADDGLTFELVLDEARRQRAEEYLAQQTMSMGQIAELVGFAEQSSFNRACQRWFAQAPKEARVAMGVGAVRSARSK